MSLNTPAARYLAKRMALSIGLLALGAAMAWAISLALLQDAAIAAGVFPQPGTPIAAATLNMDSPLWEAAKTLQWLANTAGVAGLLLVLGYGLADRYWETLEDMEADA